MILKRMTATFGRLRQETLELHEGLNIITAPNEAGKSTWAAFLLAMFYGVDTAERASRGSIPAKARYKPWSGEAMEGSVQLLHEGLDMTLERTARGRAPMAELRAYETATGRDLGPLTGQALLGVERGVYERSGFIRHEAMALTGDHALEARLSALATTGDERVSHGLVEQRLRDWKNRRRHNKTGLLPQAEAELAQVAAAQDSIARLGRETMELAALAEELEARQTKLAAIDAALKAKDAAEKRRQLTRAWEDFQKKEGFLREKEETVAGLPPMEELQALLRELDLLAESGRALEEELRLGAVTPEPPECPEVFAGLDADGVRRRAEADAAEAEVLADRRHYAPAAVWTLAAVGVIHAACAVACGVRHIGEGLTVFAALTVLAAVLAALRHGKNRRSLARRRALLQAYGASDVSGIRQAAADHREALLLHAQSERAALERRRALNARKTAHDEKWAALLSRVHAFAPDAKDVRAAAQKAVHLWQFHQAAAREVEQARGRYEAVLAAVGALPEAPEPPALPDGGTDGYDGAQIAAQLSAVRRELREVRSRLDLRRGRMEAAGDPVELAARREQLEERIARLSREYDALTLAMDALKRANDQLQTRFSPRLNRLAAEYMAKLTGGRYDRVLLSQDLSVTARETGGAVTHPLPALSAGTADQLYLAVRLAISELVLPPDAPLVLDDALLTFDDTRMRAALALLRELAERRQILLFTCHSRERAALEAPTV